MATFVQLSCHLEVFSVATRYATRFGNDPNNFQALHRRFRPLLRPTDRSVAEFCPFVDIANLAMRSHSETLRLAT